MIWSNNSLLIGGYALKLVTLFSGFLLCIGYAFLIISSIRSHYKNFFFSTLYFIVFWIITILRNQHIDSTGIVFSIIVFFLYQVGYLIASSNIRRIDIDSKVVGFFLLMALFGSMVFLFKQFGSFQPISNSNLRNTGDDSLNPNGVAFTQSLLFLFLFWISDGLNSKVYRILKMVSLSSVGVVILTTGARGAFISIFLVLSMVFYKRFLIFRPSFYGVLKLIFRIIIIIFLVSLFLPEFPFLYYKVSFIFERFFSLFNYFSSNAVDLSVNERELVYNEFSQNWQDYLFGKEKYIGYPHNLFLEIYMRWGLLGLPLILIVVLSFFMAVKGLLVTQAVVFIDSQMNNRFTIERNLLFLFSMFFVFSFLQSQTSLNLEMNRSFWLSLGYFWGCFNQRD